MYYEAHGIIQAVHCVAHHSSLWCMAVRCFQNQVFTQLVKEEQQATVAAETQAAAAKAAERTQSHDEVQGAARSLLLQCVFIDTNL